MRKLLISAYGCEPNKGSEQGVGWHWVLELAKSCEVWVITRCNNKSGIEHSLPPELTDRIHFIYYDLPEGIKRLKRKDRGLYLYYTLWQLGAYKRAKKIACEICFDYCMHLTFGSMWMPTFMYKLPIPFIWGPIGGGESVPADYIHTLPWKGRMAQYTRNLLIRTASINPMIMWPARAARAIIARTEESKRVFPGKYQHKTIVILETGMSSDILQNYESHCSNELTDYVELVYVGRLVPIKNVEASIRALKLVHDTHHNVRLTIVGDGPLMTPLTNLAKKYGVHNHIRFVGSVSQREAIQILQQSHVFLFPSLKEGGTWSLMEAMAVSLPVICMDTSGMHIITDDTCAFRISPTTPIDTIQKIAEAIVQLADSIVLRRTMGENGHRRILEHFLWSKKGVFMAEMLTHLDGQMTAWKVP